MKQATGLANLVTCYVDHCIGAQAVSVEFSTGFKFSYSGDCRPSSFFVRIGQGSTVLVHEATFDDQMQTDAEAKKHSTMSEAIRVAQAMGAKRLILTHFSQRYQKMPELGALDKNQVKFDDPKISNNGADGADAPDDPQVMGTVADLDDQSVQHQPPKPPKTKTGTSTMSSPSACPPLLATKDDELRVAIAFDFLRVRVGDIADLEKFIPTMQRLFEMSEAEEKAKAYDRPGAVAQRKKEEEKEKRKEVHDKKLQESREENSRKKEKRLNGKQGAEEKRWKEATGSEQVGVRTPRQIRKWFDANERERRTETRDFLGGEEFTVGRSRSAEVDRTTP